MSFTVSFVSSHRGRVFFFVLGKSDKWILTNFQEISNERTHCFRTPKKPEGLRIARSQLTLVRSVGIRSYSIFDGLLVGSLIIQHFGDDYYFNGRLDFLGICMMINQPNIPNQPTKHPKHPPTRSVLSASVQSHTSVHLRVRFCWWRNFQGPVVVGYLSRWWLNQPIWKICSSNWKSSPKIIRGENKKYLSCHHLAIESTTTPSPIRG